MGLLYVLAATASLVICLLKARGAEQQQLKLWVVAETVQPESTTLWLKK